MSLKTVQMSFLSERRHNVSALMNESSAQEYRKKSSDERTRTKPDVSLELSTQSNQDGINGYAKGNTLSNGASSTHTTDSGFQTTSESQWKDGSCMSINRVKDENGKSIALANEIQNDKENGKNILQTTRNADNGNFPVLEPSEEKSPITPSKTSPRHRRAQSASNPNSPKVLSPTQSDYSRVGPGHALNRFSSASNREGLSNLSVHSLQHPGLEQLQHRHTLQVPKAGSIRGSRDFSFQYPNAPEDAITTAVSNPFGRRTSMNLVRRNTRSIHSEMYLDEIPPDSDAARWAGRISQKRASRRKRKEEEEDDRVMVGTKVDEHHVNWVTAYNMLTGIRFTVSRTNAKIDRDLTDADFDAKHKFSFDITGNELTPSAKYDFKFKDYAPWVFRHLRTTFRLDPADYLVSLTSKYILSELGSPGKSGSFFYFSRDYKYIIKTIHQAEHKLLRKILRDYYAHVQDNPNTLISQFYGLHRVKIPYGRKIHFVVMNNLFPPHRDIHQTFDLKGSTVGRDFKEDELEKNPRATLKDLNWLRRNYHLEFGPMKKQLFIEQMQRDVALLQRLKIMDYSLLVGIHDVTRGNDEGLRDKTLRVFQPGGDRQEEQPLQGVLTRTPSKMENAQKARELRQIIRSEKPVPMGQSTFRMPEEAIQAKKNSVFYSDDGGFKATHENGAPGEEIYYLGIIDCLNHYGFVKRLEHFWKGLSDNKTQISPIPPEGYGDRFVKFISSITKPREQAEAEAREQAHEHSLDSSASIDMRGARDVARDGVDGPSNYRIARLSPDQLMERAGRELRKSGTFNDPDPRTLTTARSPSAERGERNGGTTLPVLEEIGEGGSTGDRSTNSRERIERDALVPNGALSPPLGGRPPPTPPKDLPHLNKDLPVLPMPTFSTSPLPMSPLNQPSA